MLRVHARVVGEHELLIFYNDVGVFLCKEHTNTVHTPRRAVGKVAYIVDQAGDSHKKHKAEQAVFNKLLCAAAVLEPAYPVNEPDDRKSRTGVQACPLAGNADAEEYTRKRQMPQPAAVYIQVHEKVHEQNEEHGVGVYRCDAGLREVHEVKGKYRSAAGGNGDAAEHFLQKHIQNRQHPDTEQRAGKAPAERGHTEKLDAEGYDELAKRGM